MKLMKLLVTMLVVAGLVVPAIAVAEDRLTLTGEMRVRGWHADLEIDDVGPQDGEIPGYFGKYFSYDEDDDISTPNTGENTATFGDQRFRLGGNIAVAEGVSLTFRMDVTEHTWGTGADPFGARAFHDSTSQWDFAYMDLKKGMFHLRAGQQYVGFGEVTAVDSLDPGLLLNIDTAVPFTIYGLVDDDNGGTSESDSFLYGIAASPTLTNNLASEFFITGFNDGMEQDVYVLGAALAYVMDPLKVVAELDVFTGDASDTDDAMGTQLFVDASFAVTPAATIGAELYYALGTDDEDEVQYDTLGNQWGGWDPILDVGTNLDNEKISFGKPFDFTGESAGVMGGRLYASAKMSDALSLAASIAYLQEEEDKFVEAEATAFAAGLTYALMANTSLQAQVQYTDAEIDDVEADATEAGVGLFVNF